MLLKELYSIILEQVETKEVYHSSPIKIDKFAPGNTVWFSLNKKDALGWHENGKQNHGTQHTMICEFVGKIADEETVEKFAAKIWPGEDFIYSMFDPAVGEFSKKDIKAFLKLFTDAGFDAAYIDDYDPSDFQSGGSTSLGVFEPSKTVTIAGVLQADGKPESKLKKDTSPYKYKVGDVVEFESEYRGIQTGKIIEIHRKGDQYMYPHSNFIHTADYDTLIIKGDFSSNPESTEVSNDPDYQPKIIS